MIQIFSVSTSSKFSWQLIWNLGFRAFDISKFDITTDSCTQYLVLVFLYSHTQLISKVRFDYLSFSNFRCIAEWLLIILLLNLQECTQRYPDSKIFLIMIFLTERYPDLLYTSTVACSSCISYGESKLLNHDSLRTKKKHYFIQFSSKI